MGWMLRSNKERSGSAELATGGTAASRTADKNRPARLSGSPERITALLYSESAGSIHLKNLPCQTDGQSSQRRNRAQSASDGPRERRFRYIQHQRRNDAGGSGERSSRARGGCPLGPSLALWASMRGWSLVKGGRWEALVGLSDPARVLVPCGALRIGLPFAVLSVLLMTSAGWGPVFRRCSLCCGFDPSSKESACRPRARSHRDAISILRRGLALSAQSLLPSLQQK